jgi:hypothetical protein
MLNAANNLNILRLIMLNVIMLSVMALTIEHDLDTLPNGSSLNYVTQIGRFYFCSITPSTLTVAVTGSFVGVFTTNFENVNEPL